MNSRARSFGFSAKSQNFRSFLFLGFPDRRRLEGVGSFVFWDRKRLEGVRKFWGVGRVCQIPGFSVYFPRFVLKISKMSVKKSRFVLKILILSEIRKVFSEFCFFTVKGWRGPGRGFRIVVFTIKGWRGPGGCPFLP